MYYYRCFIIKYVCIYSNFYCSVILIQIRFPCFLHCFFNISAFGHRAGSFPPHYYCQAKKTLPIHSVHYYRCCIIKHVCMLQLGLLCGRYRLGPTSIVSCCRLLRESLWGFPPYLAPKSSLATRWPDVTESSVGIAQRMRHVIIGQARDGQYSCTACERDVV